MMKQSYAEATIKLNVHAWLDERTGTVRYINYPVDPPGLAPADLTLLEYENIPWDIYPIVEKYQKQYPSARAEKGSHDQLMEMDGLYKQLYKMQFK